MSGVYIKGMEMPASCRECFAEKECASDFYCGCLGVDADTTCFDDERRENCPLVPVPDHGDLIDRDAYEYPGDLMDEPVIIPADKEDGEP